MEAPSNKIQPSSGHSAEIVPHVVWISGFSASGKTSVGRKLVDLLHDEGALVVFLDGDQLRSIFANRWGYERSERIDLARVYFRLCSHLCSQGLTVVIAAVAMYDEVRTWLKENVPNSIEVYLDVPEEERAARDLRTKKIYKQLGAQKDLYDLPSAPDLVLNNYGVTSIDDCAQSIFRFLRMPRSEKVVDHGRKDHWAKYYQNTSIPSEPSSFATAVEGRLGRNCRLLEVGCGNGRDASFFASAGINVVGLDLCPKAIEFCREKHPIKALEFVNGSIADIRDSEQFDVIYSRFCLHAMTPPEEDEFCSRAYTLLKSGGKLFLECRSINDPLSLKGEVISPTERIHGHYRRFIVPEQLARKLVCAGFSIDEIAEHSHVAPLGEDDPIVVRATATKI